MDCCIRLFGWRRWSLALGLGIAAVMNSAPVQAQELCGGVDYPFPYTDVSGVGAAFCPGIMEAYVTGVSKGTTPSTFSPNEAVTRVQMTTFLQRSLDQGLARTNRRAALDQWWTTQSAVPQTIAVGGSPFYCAADGADIWVSNKSGNEVIQVEANTGKVLGTWTETNSSAGVRVALGIVWTVGEASPGTLYGLNPTEAAGPAVIGITGVVGNNPISIAFDGTNLWTADYGPPGSVSYLQPNGGVPNVFGTITGGFVAPYGILYDGAHIWVTDNGANTLLKLDGAGNVLQTVDVGSGPQNAVFDGANIWVPNERDSSISVVQASTGNVVATITDNVSNPFSASFDGEHILVTNAGDGSVSFFKAADLSFIANVATGAVNKTFGACSDGINFWVTLGTGYLLRF
jgi:hypothetical protein